MPFIVNQPGDTDPEREAEKLYRSQMDQISERAAQVRRERQTTNEASMYSTKAQAAPNLGEIKKAATDDPAYLAAVAGVIAAVLAESVPKPDEPAAPNAWAGVLSKINARRGAA